MSNLRVRIVISVGAGLWLAAAPGGASTACAQTATDFAPPELWWAGAAQRAFVLYAERGDEQDGFRFFMSGPGDTRFVLSPWYPGQPQAAVMRRQRLHVFMQDGRQFSYALADQGRTERRLPNHLRPLAATVHEETPYVLAQATSATTVLYAFAATGDEPVAETADPCAPPALSVPNNSGSPEASRQRLAVAEGEHLLLTFEAGHDWMSLTAEPLPAGAGVRLAASAEAVHLFYAADGGSDEELAAWRHGRVDRRHPAAPQWEALPDLAGTADCQPLSTAVGLVAATARETEEGFDYRLCGAGGDAAGWTCSPPLAATSEALLSLPPGQVRFVPFKEVVAAFVWSDASQIRLLQYSAAGELISPEAGVIRVSPEELPPGAKWFLSNRPAIVLMLAAVMIIFWRGREAFADLPPLPGYVVAAPLWRRCLAFLLDAFPILVANLFIVSALLRSYELDQLAATEMMPWSPEAMNALVAANPMLLQVTFIAAGTFFGMMAAYFIVFEALLGASPGKLALRLVVVTASGARPRPGQVIVRNLLRFMDLYYNLLLLTLLLLLFTRRRQRLGDLVARTVVAMDTPDLQRGLEQSPPGSAEQTDRSGSLDEPEV